MCDPLQITIVLCTYNRAGTMAKTLESLASQVLPPSIGWEILVVDNNSSDETPQVVEAFRLEHPERIRYLHEKQQGISHARNAAIRNARGEILAFIDDDETAQVDWLYNLTANLYSGEWAGAGGRVLPPSSFVKTKWLASRSPFIQGPLSLFDPEIGAGHMADPPFGANMAFRKEIFERLGGFRTDLGRSGDNLLSNEDTEFGRRLMAAGLRLRYEPTALTYHPVEEHRLRRQYFRDWWFNKGRSDILEVGVQAKGRRFFGVPLRLFRDIAIEMVRWMIAVDSSQRFICGLKVWAYAGQGFESYNQSRNAKQKGLERAVSFGPSEGDGEPEFPSGGQEKECPSCKAKPSSTRGDLRYRYR
jgi:glycosyltransferase involved in cell wall biosynthesis